MSESSRLVYACNAFDILHVWLEPPPVVHVCGHGIWYVGRGGSVLCQSQVSERRITDLVISWKHVGKELSELRSRLESCTTYVAVATNVKRYRGALW